jgi:tetratricopeptide (TPR) repeat protein
VRQSLGYVVFVKRANEALVSGRLDEAAQDAAVVLERRPRDFTSTVITAEVCMRKADYRCAESRLKSALQSEPDNAYAKSLLARVYVNTGRADDAIRLLTPLMQADSAGPDEKAAFAAALDAIGAHEVAAEYYIGLGDEDEAIAAFEKALDQNPNDAEAKRRLVRLYRAKGMDQKANAVEKSIPSDSTRPKKRSM